MHRFKKMLYILPKNHSYKSFKIFILSAPLRMQGSVKAILWRHNSSIQKCQHPRRQMIGYAIDSFRSMYLTTILANIIVLYSLCFIVLLLFYMCMGFTALSLGSSLLSVRQRRPVHIYVDQIGI